MLREFPLTQISRKCWTMLEGERGFVIDTNVIIGAFFYNSNHPQLKQTYFLALALERGILSNNP